MTVLCEFNRASGLPNKRLNRPSQMFFISAAVLSEPIMAAAMPRLFKPATWSFINDTRGATTRQTEDISVCFYAFSTPTAIPSKTNGAISKHNDLPDPAGEQKNTSFPVR